MKILLTNSPNYIKDMNKQFSYGRFGCSDPIPYDLGGRYATKVKDHYVPYPWSLGYTSALLKRDTKHEIKTIDAQAEDFNEHDFIEEVEKFNPAVLMVDLPTISYGLCLDILKEIKQKNKNMVIILVGLHVSGLPEECLKEAEFADYIIQGDYSLPMLKYLKFYNENNLENKVPGLYFRLNNQIVKSNAPVEFIDFDNMPYPDRDDLPVKNYHDFAVANNLPIHMVTSRGCPFTCSYCNARVFWPASFYWKRSVKNIVDEMEYVKERFNAKQVYFDDDIMTFDKQRMIAFANEILKRKLKLPFTYMGDINIEEDLLLLLKKAGGLGLKFGVESINPEALKDIKKAWITKEKVAKFVKMCHKHGIWTHGDFIVGLPQDTPETADEMRKFAIELNLDTAQIYSAQPLPGTPFYQQAKQNNWLVAKSWDEYDGNWISPLSYPWFNKEQIEDSLMKFKREWEISAIKSYLLDPRKMYRYLRGRGLKYTIKKSITLFKNRKKGHIFVAGT